MKYFPNISARTILIVMLSVAFIATGSLAGVAPALRNCGAECCQPRDHHSADTAKVKLTSVQPMSCCAGLANSHCDLQAWPVVKRLDHFHAVQPSPYSGTIAAAEKATRITPTRANFDRPPAWTAPTEATPIYIELQSILI